MAFKAFNMYLAVLGSVPLRSRHTQLYAHTKTIRPHTLPHTVFHCDGERFVQQQLSEEVS